MNKVFINVAFITVLVALIGLAIGMVVTGLKRDATCPKCSGTLIEERYTHDDLTYIDAMCDTCTFSSTYTFVE